MIKRIRILAKWLKTEYRLEWVNEYNKLLSRLRKIKMMMTKIDLSKIFTQHPRLIIINAAGGTRVNPRSFEWIRLIPILWMMEQDEPPTIYLTPLDYKRMFNYPVYFSQ